jgi:hypothetical protein
VEKKKTKNEMLIQGLDFFDIRQNLKNFLKNQEQFKDYNFEGSSLGVILDLLAYNTHYNAFYSSMALNEAFLDSASIRNSIVSQAKHIGYVPRSAQGAEAYVDVQLTSVTSTLAGEIRNRQIKVNRYEVFKAITSEETLFFYAKDTVEFQQETNSTGDSEYWARNINIREGIVKVETFLVDKSKKNQKFIIPDENVDTRSLQIRVQKSRTSTEGFGDSWFRGTDINVIGSDSRVFFVQELYDGKYEIYFGDGIVGRELEQGNVITLIYSVCNGSAGNLLGINENVFGSTPTFTYSSVSVSSPAAVYIRRDENGLPIPSSGGSEPEEIESIRFYAPKFYQSQDRAVTVDDYISFLSGAYSNVFKSIFVWGGEDNDPPQYGKIFISVKPQKTLKLSTVEKINLQKNILKARNIISVTPEIVDPDYTFIVPIVNIKYKESELEMSEESLKLTVSNTITDFGENVLSRFDKNFYASQLIEEIKSISPAIKSCSIQILLKKYIEIVPNSEFTYNIKFGTRLIPRFSERNYISSSIFRTRGKSSNSLQEVIANAYIEDDGSGFLRTVEQKTNLILNQRQGIVDYVNGNITLNRLILFPNPISLENRLSVAVRPFDVDVLSSRNNILEFETRSIVINANKI